MASSGMNCMRHQSHEANGTPSVDQVNTPLHLQAIIMRKKQNQKTLLPYSRCLVQSHHQVRATHMELKLDACKQGGNREMCLCIRASNEQVRSQQGQKGHDAKPKRKRRQIAFRSHHMVEQKFFLCQWVIGGCSATARSRHISSPLPSDTASQLMIQANSSSTPLP